MSTLVTLTAGPAAQQLHCIVLERTFQAHLAKCLVACPQMEGGGGLLLVQCDKGSSAVSTDPGKK